MPTPSMSHHALASGERDTYHLRSRDEKETARPEDILEHWETRATRDGVQAVMSARHTFKENERATLELQKEVLEFLDGMVDGKEVFELGVGIGRMTSELAKRASKVVGIDFSKTMLEKARGNLAGHPNIHLIEGRLTEAKLPQERFDLAFESIVLLHILNPDELRGTARRMRELSDRICIVEHTAEADQNFPISGFTILRTPGEYEELFKPFRLAKQKTHLCAGDTFTLMLFEKHSEPQK